MKDSDFNNRQRMPLKQVMATIEDGLPAMDTARAQGFSQLGQLRTAKSRSLAREQMLLARKQGPDHPRIGVAARRLAVNEQLRRDLTAAQAAAETPLPATDETRFVAHGFVRRRKDQVGIQGLTLALGDAKGQWVRETGYACTDARGYFAITVVPNDKTQDAPTTPPRASLRSSLVLRVFDRKGGVLHTEKAPVVIRPGAMDYRVIFLDDSAAACGCNPPPAQTGETPQAQGPVLGPKPDPVRPASAGPPSPAAPNPSAPAPRSSPKRKRS